MVSTLDKCRRKWVYKCNRPKSLLRKVVTWRAQYSECRLLLAGTSRYAELSRRSWLRLRLLCRCRSPNFSSHFFCSLWRFSAFSCLWCAVSLPPIQPATAPPTVPKPGKIRSPIMPPPAAPSKASEFEDLVLGLLDLVSLDLVSLDLVSLDLVSLDLVSPLSLLCLCLCLRLLCSGSDEYPPLSME